MSPQKVVASRFFGRTDRKNSDQTDENEDVEVKVLDQDKSDAESPEEVCDSDSDVQTKIPTRENVRSYNEIKGQISNQNPPKMTTASEFVDLCNAETGEEIEKENNLEQELPSNHVEIKKANPFAQYAFGSTAQISSKADARNQVYRSRKWMPQRKSEPVKKKAKKDNWIPFPQLSEEEQSAIRRKWQGLVINEGDPLLSLEDRRFQVFVASRLHARCQESVVRKCMRALHENRVLSCTAMANADPEVLANLLTSLQYYNTKSKHLVKASNELLEKFEGMVPERHDDLLELTGIGPVMADLLSNVNTRDAYKNTV
mmetsp:Transcript_12626/g.18561  ORF Transcript_12626/g.18561 Transcript_12626/m.18561 type:complete len:315 (-) Transcript_12626:21-965(-)